MWNLSAGNRVQVLNPADITDPYVASLTDPAVQADLLATVSTYSADGSELLDQQGPMHQIALTDGTLVDARTDMVTAYDDGAPNSDQNPNAGNAPYELPTSVTTQAITATGDTLQAQTTTTGYDPVHSGDASGWDLGQATSQTDAGGLTTTTSYDTAGRVTSQQQPADDGSDGQPDSTGERTTNTTYYTATSSGPCANAAEAGLVCSTTPHANTSDAAVPTTTYSYDLYDNPVTETQTYGTGSSQAVRTTTNSYDAAERETGSAVTVSPSSAGGTALPAVSYSYDPATGLPTGSSTTTAGTTTSLITGYDSLGQATSYTDATGTESHTGYDLDGRVTTVDDGKGTTSYSYDPHSGLVTSEDIGVPGSPSTFTAAYDADGNLTSETYPNGLVATSSYDNAGELTDLDYAMNSVDWMDFQQDFTAQGQVADQTSPLSAQTFTYDGSDRLTQVQDTTSDPVTDAVECTTRIYSFNDDSDRVALQSYPDAGDDPANGDCSTSTTPVSTNYTYDAADRMTSDSAGTYTYDTLGRTTTMPAGDASGIGAHEATTGALTVDYYANDMVQSEAQGGEVMSFTLDPDQDRIASYTDNSTTTTTINHYNGDNDSPTWTQTGSDWTRNLTGPGSGLDATVNQNGVITLELADPHGDVVATAQDSTTATGTTTYEESTEYGQPRDLASTDTTYGWLGSEQRSTDDLAGLTLMGVRLYNPTTGRFLSVDPVPGGNANAYIYPDDPINNFDAGGTEKLKKLSKEEEEVLAKVALGKPISAQEKRIFNSAKKKIRFNEKVLGTRNKQKRASERDKGTFKLVYDTLVLAGLRSQIRTFGQTLVKVILGGSIIGGILGGIVGFIDAELIEQI